MSTFDFYKLKERWPSAIVARTEIKRFSGGLISPKTMANLDSKGEGPPSIRLCRKIGYPVDSLITWLTDRAKEG